MEEAGRLDAAISYYETAVSMNPNHPAYVGNLIRARLQRGDPPELLRAEIHQLRFVEHRPDWRAWVDDHTNLFDNPRLEKPTEINDLSTLLNELNNNDPNPEDDAPRVILDSSTLTDSPSDTNNRQPDAATDDLPAELAPAPQDDANALQPAPSGSNSQTLQPQLRIDSSSLKPPNSSGWKATSSKPAQHPG